MRNLIRPFEDFLCLFFPHLCLACEYNSPPYGEHICTACRATLPEANFHFRKENPFTEKFWGRVNLHAGAPMYLFTKESRVQNMVHNLKYKRKAEVGTALGRKMGSMLRQSPLFAEVDVIVPVPLHVRKLRIRGYNQSEVFGNGISETFGRPCLGNAMRRIVHSESQTKQSREARLHNVGEVFEVAKPKILEGKHILLVDDVLTTGATLEVCANRLLDVPGTKVSMATIAIAMQ
ncbi:MAG: ComF family protein [Saprospiraceae bacterium]|nr:ComF family protein [Saprospiraceae bacterium]MCF8252428.1 ComF family protein [Saprospiraceae bacterium]MCF8280720.1 ComF family protein [Bacteroidales bacterium]MCF8314004.1 ComF family protein [Saprospiraceae bacterium]MCF8442758.1 ComF family protein [Saprospiraceae bacterium]